ncbi:MAG: LysE family translocator [Alphaproteobacteria bacterium]
MVVEPALLAAFAGATLLLVAFPGPNVTLMVSQAAAHGPRTGLVVLAGTEIGLVLQLALVTAGLASVLNLFAEIFGLLRWIGVGVLLAFAVQAWRQASRATPVIAAPRHGRLFTLGFAIAMANPKTLLFHAAFLPQFVDPARPATAQLVLLAVTFAVLAVAGDTVWTLAGAGAGRFLRRAGRMRMLGRVSAVVLAGAALALAAARR